MFAYLSPSGRTDVPRCQCGSPQDRPPRKVFALFLLAMGHARSLLIELM